MSMTNTDAYQAAMLDSRKLIAWYDFQARFYRLWRHRYQPSLLQSVAAILRAGPPETRLLDAGCGTGLVALGLAHHVRWQLSGIDASLGMLRVARGEALRRRLRNVTLCRGDVHRLPYADAAFDAVVVAGLIPYLHDPVAALGEFHRVLRPGGTYLSIEFDRSAIRGSTRLFFLLMISGWRVISRLFPRYRYAEDWDVESGLLDPATFETQLGASRFHLLALRRLSSHLLFHSVKEERGSVLPGIEPAK